MLGNTLWIQLLCILLLRYTYSYPFGVTSTLPWFPCAPVSLRPSMKCTCQNLKKKKEKNKYLHNHFRYCCNIASSSTTHFNGGTTITTVGSEAMIIFRGEIDSSNYLGSSLTARSPGFSLKYRLSKCMHVAWSSINITFKATSIRQYWDSKLNLYLLVHSLIVLMHA